MKKTKKRIIGLIVTLIIALFTIPYFASSLDLILSSKTLITQNYFTGMFSFFSNSNSSEQIMALIILVFYLMGYVSLAFNFRTSIEEKGVIHITDKISIPEAVGNGQHGKARFATEKEKQQVYKVIEYTGQKEIHEKVGLVLGMEKKGDKEIIYCSGEEDHSVMVAQTGSGKTRGSILETIWLLGKTKESQIDFDVKGDLLPYTYPFLEENGSKVFYLNFREAKKSMRFNFLQNILNCLSEGDKAGAIDKTWDLVSTLVGEVKGEKIWNDGECSTIAAGILAVAIDAPSNCKNLTNVYYFIAKMCEWNEEIEDMPINLYFKALPDTHPAVGVFAQAKIAPSRTRGSFFTAALGTLRHFTNPNIAAMTSESDFDLSTVVTEKCALFLIFPDDNKKLYPLGSLFMDMMYQVASEVAYKNGGPLPVDLTINADEIGNFPKFMSLEPITTAGRGKGVRINAALQALEQLDEKYGKEAKTIRGNFAHWLYIRTSSPDTQKMFSNRLGTYTVQSQGQSASNSENNGRDTSSSGNSSNMTGRPLLYPDEVGLIESPDALCFTSAKHPAMMKMPDLSEYRANKELGLGSKKHNQKVIIDRMAALPDLDIPSEPILWGIWNKYSSLETKEEKKTERISFL